MLFLFQVIGASILLGIVVLAASLSLFELRRCCRGTFSFCNKATAFDKLILMEEQNVRIDILTKLAKEKLTKKIMDKIHTQHSKDCFDVAEELIDAPIMPTSTTSAAEQDKHQDKCGQ